VDHKRRPGVLGHTVALNRALKCRLQSVRWVFFYDCGFPNHHTELLNILACGFRPGSCTAMYMGVLSGQSLLDFEI